jgi:peptidyl-prolyl cis-trans isomerase SDCCAG10
MFGRIEGDTIYNLMKMADAELTEEGSDRPLYPTKVTGAEVLVNPFEDMVVRAREAPRTKADEGKKEAKKRKKPAGKNVLSFGGEEGEEEAAPVMKKVKANPKLVVVEDDAEDVKEVSKVKKTKDPKPRQRTPTRSDEDNAPAAKPAKANVNPPADEMEVDSPLPSPETKRNNKLASTNAEIAALKASMRRTNDTKSSKAQEAPKSALEALIPATSTRGRRRGKAPEEKGAMDMFKAFKERLETLPSDKAGVEEVTGDEKKTNGTKAVPDKEELADDDEATLCDLHFIANCQSCKSWDEQEGEGADGKAGGEDDEDDAGWMAHQLSFAKDTLGKDLEWKRKMAEIEVIDPREKARTIQEEGRKKKGKGKDTKVR